MFIKHISSLPAAKTLLKTLGVDPVGVEIMSKKILKSIVKIKNLDIRAANILKQEALAADGDLAVPKKALTLKEKKVDAVLIMDQGNLERLLKKLKIQAFGLPEIAKKIKETLTNYQQNKFILKSRNKELILDKPVIMGILNLTPDSFSDGGQFNSPKKSQKRITDMIAEGAQIIDLGGESTGPGSPPVPPAKELSRIIPVLNSAISSFQNLSAVASAKADSKLKINSKLETRNSTFDIRHSSFFSKSYKLKAKSFLFPPAPFLSIDTCKPAVAQKCLALGADMINDVTALRQGGREMGELIAKHQVPLVLMYAKDNSPRTTLKKINYQDVVETISEFLIKRIEFAFSCGIKKEQIIIDPGMGAFVSSSPEPSLEILRRLKEFKSLGYPILIGASRKSFIAACTRGQLSMPPAQRLAGSLASAIIAAQNGAQIIRVHDVKETADAVNLTVKINSF